MKTSAGMVGDAVDDKKGCAAGCVMIRNIWSVRAAQRLPGNIPCRGDCPVAAGRIVAVGVDEMEPGFMPAVNLHTWQERLNRTSLVIDDNGRKAADHHQQKEAPSPGHEAPPTVRLGFGRFRQEAWDYGVCFYGVGQGYPVFTEAWVLLPGFGGWFPPEQKRL